MSLVDGRNNKMLILLISNIEPEASKGKDSVSNDELVEIARRVKRYDPEALSRLFDLYFEKLRRYMYYKTGSREKAEDLAAEALTKGIESIDRFKDQGGTIGAWLFGIARNLLARDREAEGKAESVQLEEDLSIDTDEQPEPLVIARVTAEELYKALGELPDEQREVVLLRFMEGYDARTTGQIMGKRPGAIRALQFRAIRSLKEMFGPEGAEA